MVTAYNADGIAFSYWEGFDLFEQVTQVTGVLSSVCGVYAQAH